MMNFPPFQISPPKFLMTFFSHRPKISNSPIFSVSVHFPLFRENYYFPLYFSPFPPVLDKFTSFYIFSVYLVSLCFHPDAFLHHPMHILDASDNDICKWKARDWNYLFINVQNWFNILKTICTKNGSENICNSSLKR